MELTHLYTHSSKIGYGRMGVELSAALERRDVDVYDGRGPGPDGETLLDLVERENTYMRGVVDAPKDRPAKTTNLSLWSAAPGHAEWWYQSQHAAMLTMYETMTLPESYRESLHNFDTILVPSEQNLELFSQYHPNVHLLPLGVDGARWVYRARRDPGLTFNFLIGGSGPRKGTDVAVAAFERTFAKWTPAWGPEPVLMMKNPRGEPFNGPRIRMTSGHITNDEEVELYAQAHCYLQPSRGEGFGLQPLQAIAQGIPTILTNAHGHAGFAHLGIPIGAAPSKAGPFIYGDSGEWWEPDFEQLCDAMLDVYRRPHHWFQYAKHGAAEVAYRWTWDNTADRFIELLGDQMSVPYQGDGSYFVPELLEFPMVLKRDYQCDIGGTIHRFERDLTYYVSADVKRVLFDAGLVVGGANAEGLSAEQVDQLEGRRHTETKCPTCGQESGAAPTRGEELVAIAEAVGPWQDMLAAVVNSADENHDGIPDENVVGDARHMLQGSI